MVKSMLDGTKNGTGSGAMRLRDKGLGKSLTLSGPRPPNQKIPFMLQSWYEDQPTSAKCRGYSEKTAHICVHLCFYRVRSLKKLFLR